ncbi:MAG: TRAM domain-containing protein [Pseudomonadota bacterium]
MPRRPADPDPLVTTEFEAVITDLAAGGKGVARLTDGRVVFVAGALTGERVSARITRAKRDYAEAETLGVLEPSPERVAPACPLYGDCGGCDLMHLACESQVQAKAAWVTRALRRMDGLPALALRPSPLAWGYRNRVRLQVDERGRVGFFAKESHRLVPVAQCPVASPGVNRVLPGLSEVLAGPQWAGRVEWAEVMAGGADEPALLCLGWAGDSEPPDPAPILAATGAAGLRWATDEGLEPWPLRPENGLVYYQQEGLDLHAFPGLFSQVNWAANQHLVAAVMAAAQGLEPGAALDLYAGGGNFTLPLLAAGWRVTAVEGQQEACQAGYLQALWAGLADGMRVRAEAAETALEALVQADTGFDLVVLDPPRSGAKGLMGLIAGLAPRRVAYVSCHPAALGRDASALAAAGYRPNQLTVLDLFPHTGHVEAVLVLER